MVRGKDVLKLPVVTRDGGEKVGEVKDLVVDRGGRRVVGIVVEEKGLIGEARVVAWEEIVAVGRDAVIARSAGSVVKSSEIPEMNEILERGFALHGLRVGTTAGTDLGKIENFFFDRQTGAVEGFELSGAVSVDASGQVFLPASSSFEAGKDYAFVDPSAAENMVDLKEALKNSSIQ